MNGLYENAKNSACIDHHINEIGFTKNDWIVPDASSTAELIYMLMDEEQIDTDIAQCIYMGLVHDTGVFHPDGRVGTAYALTGA